MSGSNQFAVYLFASGDAFLYPARLLKSGRNVEQQETRYGARPCLHVDSLRIFGQAGSQ